MAVMTVGLSNSLRAGPSGFDAGLDDDMILPHAGEVRLLSCTDNDAPCHSLLFDRAVCGRSPSVGVWRELDC